MAISVGVGGAWKKALNIWVGVGGAWKRVTSLKVGVGGAWKEGLDIVTLSGATIADLDEVSGTSQAVLRLNADGTVDQVTTSGGTDQLSAATDWVIPNSAASGDYQVRATLQSGDTPTGTLDTWETLDIARTWSLTQSGTGETSCVLLIEIRIGGVVQDSGTYTISATVV